MNKICSQCKTEKPHTEFFKNKTSKDGLRSNCKVCTTKATKVYYEANKEKIHKQMRAYQKANPDKVKAYNKRRANPS